MIEIVQSDLSLAIEESQAVIEFDSLPSIHAHTVEITQVFENLINNAIKFRSSTPPRIQISAEQQPESWTIFVKDNGIGIPEDSLERVFVMFQRLHYSNQLPRDRNWIGIMSQSYRKLWGNPDVHIRPR